MIEKQARYAAKLSFEAAERFIQQQLKIQADAMRRKGIDDNLVTQALNCMEDALRSALGRETLIPRGRS